MSLRKKLNKCQRRLKQTSHKSGFGSGFLPKPVQALNIFFRDLLYFMLFVQCFPLTHFKFKLCPAELNLTRRDILIKIKTIQKWDRVMYLHHETLSQKLYERQRTTGNHKLLEMTTLPLVSEQKPHSKTPPQP